MGETDLHIHWMKRLYDLLKYRYRDERIYIGHNLLVYYDEGFPGNVIVPDVFVARDCDPGFRRTFRIWDEQQAPNVVFEITSKSTRTEDEVRKPCKYQEMGVREFFLFDPTGDYLNPQLQGYRLNETGLGRVEPDADGMLESQELDLQRSLMDDALVLRDRATQEILLTEGEAQRVEAETQRVAREIAESRANAAEEELRGVREELNRLRGSGPSASSGD